MVVSYAMLAILLIGPLMFLMGNIDLEKNILWLNVATIIWFATAPFWIGRKAQ